MGDFQADTMALSMMEQGAYDRLLDYYYATEQPIPLNPERAAIICRAVTLEERAAVSAVLDQFFTRETDGFHNKRADRELAAAQTARDNGGKGGRPKKTQVKTETQTESKTGDVTQTLTGTGHPPTTNHQPKTKTLRVVADTEFGRFWKSWPSTERKVAKAKCEQVWRRLQLDAVVDQIIPHIEAMKETDTWKRGFEPAPLTYLNQRRWEDGAVERRDDFADCR